MRDLEMSASPMDVRSELAGLYGEHRADRLLERFADLVEGYRQARPERLRQRDETLAHDWFRDPRNAVYVLYADRFCPEAARGQKLSALRESLPYFQELGVNILHVLPILASTGDDGFAVSNYRKAVRGCPRILRPGPRRAHRLSLRSHARPVAGGDRWKRRSLGGRACAHGGYGKGQHGKGG
jgi:hypothetical protein